MYQCRVKFRTTSNGENCYLCCTRVACDIAESDQGAFASEGRKGDALSYMDTESQGRFVSLMAS